MPRNNELLCNVSRLESKLEFMMETVMGKIDLVYEVSTNKEKKQHEVDTLRQEVTFLRAQIYEFESKAALCTCSKSSGTSMKGVVELLHFPEPKCATSPATQSHVASLWKKFKPLTPRQGKSKTPVHLVDVKSLAAKWHPRKSGGRQWGGKKAADEEDEVCENGISPDDGEEKQKFDVEHRWDLSPDVSRPNSACPPSQIQIAHDPGLQITVTPTDPLGLTPLKLHGITLPQPSTAVTPLHVKTKKIFLPRVFKRKRKEGN